MCRKKLDEIKKKLFVFREGDEDILEFVDNNYMQFTPLIRKLLREEMIRKGVPVNSTQGLEITPNTTIYQQPKLELPVEKEPVKVLEEEVVEIEEYDEFMD